MKPSKFTYAGHLPLDSAALRYADLLPMHECRTAAQLTEVVEALLPV